LIDCAQPDTHSAGNGSIGPCGTFGAHGSIGRSGARHSPCTPATFASARATGRFSGRQAGFRFTSTPGASTDTTYAEIGTERNGVFLR
jgi:hypothetical protein